MVWIANPDQRQNIGSSTYIYSRMIDQKGRPLGAALSHLYRLWTVLTGLDQRHSNKHPTDGIHCCCGLKNPYTQWSGLQIQTNGHVQPIGGGDDRCFRSPHGG